MRKRKFTPSVEIMGLRLAPSGAMPVNIPDPTVESSGPTANPLVADGGDNLVYTSIPPMFCPGLMIETH